MKKFLLVLLLPFGCLGQKNEVLSDTSIFMGITKNEALLQVEPNFTGETIRGLPDGTMVAVISYQNSFWKVMHGTDIGYIDEVDLDLLEEKRDYLKSRRHEGEDIRAKIAIETSAYLIKSEIDKLEKVVKSYEKKGFVVTSWSFSNPNEYSGAIDVSFNIYNPNKKTIKYVWFTLTAYNPVNDVVGKPQTVKGIGPVEYEGEVSWDFENVFFSKIIVCMRISKVKIQYMDGTFREYPNPNLIMGDGEVNSCK